MQDPSTTSAETPTCPPSCSRCAELEKQVAKLQEAANDARAALAESCEPPPVEKTDEPEVLICRFPAILEHFVRHHIRNIGGEHTPFGISSLDITSAVATFRLYGVHDSFLMEIPVQPIADRLCTTDERHAYVMEIKLHPVPGVELG